MENIVLSLTTFSASIMSSWTGLPSSTSTWASGLIASLWFCSMVLNDATPGRNDFRPPV